MSFERVDQPPPELRQAYLDGLPEPQELFLEKLVRTGATWTVPGAAYAVECEGSLVEFYVVPAHAHRLVELFDAAMAASGALRVLCKSYDHQIMFGALSKASRVTTAGLLFRKFSEETESHNDDEFTFRQGSHADADLIFNSFNRDFMGSFFESRDEMRSYVSSGDLHILENSSGEILGCGIAKAVIDGRPEMDIGMLVAPAHRRQGHGTQIVARLRKLCLDRGQRPICGCSMSNTGAQRTLERAGFVSEHRTLVIEAQILPKGTLLGTLDGMVTTDSCCIS